MSDRWGRPNASDFLSLGAIGGQIIKEQQADDDRLDEKQANQATSLLVDQGEKADLSKFTPTARIKGLADYAKLQADQKRNSREGIELEKEKMAMSLKRMEDIGRNYLFARETGDAAAIDKTFMQFTHHAHNNVREVEPLNDGKYRLHLLDGTSRDIAKPTIQQMDNAVKGYLADPKIHIESKLKEEELIRDYNYKSARSPEVMKNDQGQTVFRISAIDKETRQPMDTYVTENMQPLTQDQVRQGGFKPLTVVKQENEFGTQSNLATKNALIGGALGKPDPKTAYTTRGGKTMAEPFGGGASVPIDPKDMPASPDENYATAIDPDTHKEIILNKKQYQQMQKDWEDGVKLLGPVKDTKGNVLSISDLSNVNEATADSLIDHISRIRKDPKASPESKAVAESLHFILQARGYAPPNPKGAKNGVQASSSFKQGWDLHRSLEGHPDKQQALLEAWRSSGDGEYKKVADQIGKIYKKTNHGGESTQNVEGGRLGGQSPSGKENSLTGALSDMGGGVIGLGKRYYDAGVAAMEGAEKGLVKAGESEFTKKLQKLSESFRGVD